MSKGFKKRKNKGKTQHVNQSDQVIFNQQVMGALNNTAREVFGIKQALQQTSQVIGYMRNELSAQADTLRYTEVEGKPTEGLKVMLDVVGRIDTDGELGYNFVQGSSRGTVYEVGNTASTLVPQEVQDKVLEMEVGEYAFVNVEYPEAEKDEEGNEIPGAHALAGRKVRYDFKILKIFRDEKNEIDGIIEEADEVRKVKMEEAQELAKKAAENQKKEAEAKAEAETTEETTESAE